MRARLVAAGAREFQILSRGRGLDGRRQADEQRRQPAARAVHVATVGHGEDEEEGEGKEHSGLMTAIRTILIADLVMSLDNVIAVAAAAKGSMTLLVLGLAISIPLVIFGSKLMIKLMDRFPVIITFGAALIGWVGGETIVSDVALKSIVEANGWLHYVAPAAGAALVLAIGKMGQKAKAE